VTPQCQEEQDEEDSGLDEPPGTPPTQEGANEPVPASPSESEDDELIPESEYHRSYKRRHQPDRDDYDGWGDKRRPPDGDLVVFHDGKTYLTDAQRFMADTGSFQFCKDLNEEMVSIDEVETPQSTLIALHMNRLSGKLQNAKDDISWRLGETMVKPLNQMMSSS
jgi:hypothetical protein